MNWMKKINELVGEVRSTVVKKRQPKVFGLGARGNWEPLKVLEQKSDLVNEEF